jgi:tetratricopeptide (TPR) repeat protein
MRFQRGTFLALAAAVAVGACAPAATTGAPGAPRETAQTRAATLFLAQAEAAEGERRQELYEQALEQSLRGVEAAPNNPQHYYLAGIAHAGLDDFEAADTMWDRALEMFPDFEGDIAIAREQAWAQAFNHGVNAYNAGDLDEAVEQWRRANQVFDRRPEAYFNLAAVYSQREQYDRAIDAFRSSVQALERAPGRELTEEEQAEREESRLSALQNLGNLQLFTEQFGEAEQTFRRLAELRPDDVQARSSLATALARQGRQAEAMQVYTELLGQPGLSSQEMMSVGVGLFQAQEYGRAADAFRRITEMQPNNRDAWYNFLNALYAQERWQDAIPVAERLLELDPLNENANLILLQAFRDTRQQQRALAVAERNQAAPIHVDDLQMRFDNGRATLRGAASGNRAAQGTPVRLEFTFYGEEGQTLGTQTVTVNAPAQNATAPFDVSMAVDAQPTGFRYRVLQ